MSLLFEAAKEWFDTDAELKQVGRALYEGANQDKAKPHVTFEIVDGENQDAFDSEHRSWSVRFTIVNKDRAGGSSKTTEIAESLMRRFDNQGVPMSGWSNAVFIYSGESGASQDDNKLWKLTIDYTAFASRDRMVPAVRSI